MTNFWIKLRDQVTEFWKKLERRNKIIISSLIAAIIVFSIVLAVFLNRVEYVPLYTNLPPDEAGSILTALDDMAIPYKTEGAGTILVPAEQASEVEMRLSAQGFNDGGLALDIWNSSSGITATESERETLANYQNMENIRATILQIDKIEDAIVLLTPGDDSAYLVNPAPVEAGASVMLTIKNNETLTPAEANSIAAIVTGAVAGLIPENVRIIDSNLNLYPVGEENEVANVDVINEQMALTEQVRLDLEEQISNLLAPVFGEQNVRPAVNVRLDFDRETVNSVQFEPPIEGEDGGIPVSIHEAYEQVLNAVPEDGGVPGADTNGLNIIEYPYGDLTADEYYRNYVRDVNYEINETQRQIEVAQGTIEQLSIAILLDSETVTEDYSANVENLVSNAIGVAEDYISVERLPFNFANSEINAAMDRYEQMMADAERQALIRTAIIALAVVILVVLIFLLIRSILKSQQAARDAEMALAMAEAGMAIDYIAGDDEELGEEGEGVGGIEMAGKSETVLQIEKFIESNPSAVASLLRNWLNEDNY